MQIKNPSLLSEGVNYAKYATIFHADFVFGYNKVAL